MLPNAISAVRNLPDEPELTYSLPQYQTESGCVDILMHTMERYFVNIETMEITDSISESLMQTVIYNARILMRNLTTTQPAQRSCGQEASLTMV